MLRTFLQSYKKSLPPIYNKLITNQVNHPNLIIHHPIETVSTAHPLTSRIRTMPQSTIPRGVNILMLSTSQSFSSEDLIGATTTDKNNVNQFFENAKSNYEMFESEEFQGLYRVLIQVYANQPQLSEGQMPLHDFAKALLSQAFYDTKNPANNTPYKLGLEFEVSKYLKYIRSNHFLNTIKSMENHYELMHKYIQKDFLKTSNLKQFVNLVKLVRAQLRQIHENSKITNLVLGETPKRVFALAPILPSLKQSYSPNCVLVGKYFTHLRQSFYCLETLKEIKGGEQLTIPVKKITNYDRFFRDGYRSIVENPDNPYNEYILLINLIDPQIPAVAEILMTGDIESKRFALAAHGLKMKSLIRISANGRIRKEDMKMLRILFGQFREDQLDKDQIEIDKKIYKFIEIFARLSLQAHNSQNIGKSQTMEKDINPDVVKAFRIMEQGQIKILVNFMAMINQICKA